MKNKTPQELQPKEQKVLTDELIVELLSSKMSVKELINQINLRCTKRYSLRSSRQDLTKRLLGLRADGKISYEQEIRNQNGVVVDSKWIAKSHDSLGKTLLDSESSSE